jgi:hypothetical protein
MRIDGGGGVDTLKIDGGGLTLDLANIKAEAMQNLEKVDLTGSGDNTLKLNVHDLLENFTSANVWNAGNTTGGTIGALVSRNQLMIDGNAGDKVILTDLANWSGPSASFVHGGKTYVGYNLDSAQLLIEQGVSLSAS